MAFLAAFARRYSLDEEDLHEWKHQYEHVDIIRRSVHDIASPPMFLDAIAVAAVNQFPSSRGSDENQAQYQQRFNTLLDAQLSATFARR